MIYPDNLDGELKKKKNLRILKFWHFEVFKSRSATNPAKINDLKRILANYRQTFHNQSALMVCSLSLCVFTTEALTRIVILRDFWNCNWPGWLTCQFLQLPSCVKFCLQRTTFNFLSHLLRWGTLHGIYTKAAGKQMQMKKPHWNKGRCLVKDKAKIILPANYLLPLASMCLGCNTIPFHPWILKHHKAYINWPVFK